MKGRTSSITPQQSVMIQAMRNTATMEAMAEYLGVSVKAIQYHVHYVLDKKERIRNRPGKKLEKVWRCCLKCQKNFRASGRFVRVCEGCKRGEEYQAGPFAAI